MSVEHRDKLRSAQARREPHDDSAPATTGAYHDSLQFHPRLVSFIRLFDGARQGWERYCHRMTRKLAATSSSIAMSPAS